jgi:hypothetical protein
VRKSLLLTTLLLWGSGDPGMCAAQERIALGVTAGLSSQPQGDGDQPYLGPGFGGTSVAGLLFVDADVAGRVSVGGEASLGSNINGHQQQRASGGTNDLSSGHRDTIFSSVVKLNALDRGRAQAAAILGAGVAWRHTIRSGTFHSDRPPFATTPVEQTLSNAVFATTVGFDGAIAVGAHAALVWTGRFHVLKDDDRDESGVVRRGVASTIFRFGGGARFRF